MFRIEFDDQNDSFKGPMEDSRHQEIARILRAIAHDVEHGRIGTSIFDLNGNCIGSITE